MSNKNFVKINCKVGFASLSQYHIRPLRVGSLDYPERYRNPGALLFLAHGEVSA
jgi:hypothetical protein